MRRPAITPEEIVTGVRARSLSAPVLIGAIVAAELVVFISIIVSAGMIVNGRSLWGALAAAVLP